VQLVQSLSARPALLRKLCRSGAYSRGMKILLLALLIAVPGFAAAQSFTLGSNVDVHTTEHEPLPEDQAFQLQAVAMDRGTLLLRWQMPEHYYLYRMKAEVSAQAPAGLTLGEAQWPAGKAHHDEHFGEVEVYFDQAEVRVPIAELPAGATEVTVRAKFQGCLEDAVCYPVMRRDLKIALPAR